MKMNDFSTDTGCNTERRGFSRKVRILIVFSVLFTGLFSAAGVAYVVSGIKEKVWETMGMTAFAWNVLAYAVTICCFIALVNLAVNKKSPFSKTIVFCIWTVGSMFAAASVLFPRLSDYQTSGFEFFSYGDFVLIDGKPLLIGMLFIIFGSLIKAGFEMQREIDEIL